MLAKPSRPRNYKAVPEHSMPPKCRPAGTVEIRNAENTAGEGKVSDTRR